MDDVARHALTYHFTINDVIKVNPSLFCQKILSNKVRVYKEMCHSFTTSLTVYISLPECVCVSFKSTFIYIFCFEFYRKSLIREKKKLRKNYRIKKNCQISMIIFLVIIANVVIVVTIVFIVIVELRKQ